MRSNQLILALALCATSGCGMLFAAVTKEDRVSAPSTASTEPDQAPRPEAPRARAKKSGFDLPDTKLEEAISNASLGCRKDGSVLTGRLESFKPLTLSVKPGRCYAAVLKLGSGASISDVAHPGVDVCFSDDCVDGAVGRGAVIMNRCADSASKWTFDVRVPGAGGSRAHELGQGPFTVQFWSRKEGEGEPTRVDDPRLRAQDCRECKNQLNRCIEQGGAYVSEGSSCAKDFLNCLDWHNVPRPECGA